MRRWSPQIAYIENVWPRFVGTRGGGMGFNAANRFMDNVGALRGITACEVDECYQVTPVSWKRRFNLLKQSKDASRARFAELFPASAHLVKRKKDENRAEAGLIAIYGAVKHGIIGLETAS